MENTKDYEMTKLIEKIKMYHSDLFKKVTDYKISSYYLILNDLINTWYPMQYWSYTEKRMTTLSFVLDKYKEIELEINSYIN